MLRTRLISAAFLIFVVVFVLSLSPQSWFYFLYILTAFTTMTLAATEFIALRWGITEGPSYVELPIPKLKLKHFQLM